MIYCSAWFLLVPSGSVAFGSLWFTVVPLLLSPSGAISVVMGMVPSGFVAVGALCFPIDSLWSPWFPLLLVPWFHLIPCYMMLGFAPNINENQDGRVCVFRVIAVY